MTRTNEQTMQFLRHAIGKGTLCLERHVGACMHLWRGHRIDVHYAHDVRGYEIYFDGVEYIYNTDKKELKRNPKPTLK